MILVDYSGIGIAAVIMEVARGGDNTIEESYGYHLILNSVRRNMKMFAPQFGDMIIACDSGGSWRKELFPEYKASRAKSKTTSKLQWDEIYKVVNGAQDILREAFPVWVVEKHGCEADDIIGNIAVSSDEPVLIVSRDKDFHQLLIRPNILQWRPQENELIVRTDCDPSIAQWVKSTFGSPKFSIKWVSEGWAQDYLKEHIIRGDGGDGVPNVMSDDDTFVDPDKRQKAMRKKQFVRLMKFWEDQYDENITKEERRNIQRNIAMIDLSYMNGHCSKINDQYYAVEKKVQPVAVKGFLMEHSLMKLASTSSDFFITKQDQKSAGIAQFFNNYK